MKVVIYNQQKKITVKNIELSDNTLLETLADSKEIAELRLNDIIYSKLQITSTLGRLREEAEMCLQCAEENNDITEEESGINWQQETVN